jgi:tetratricopeptide (TPR) repeat protein
MTKRWTIVLTLGLALGVVGGCGENVEVRMQRAQIALQSNKPDQALQLASAVLAEQPDNVEAVNVVAASQLRLGKLDAARQTLADLLKRQPDSEDAHRMMISWSFHRLTDILKQSDVVQNVRLQQEFAEVSKLGLEHVDWLHNTKKKAAEADYMRAMFADRDARRLRLTLEKKQGSLQSVQLPGEDPEQSPAQRLAQLESQIEARFNDADGHLRRCLETKPDHFPALAMRLAIARDLGRWTEVVEIARAVSAQKDVPPSVAEDVVTGLAQSPRNVLSVEDAVAIGTKTHQAVNEKGRKNPVWTLTSGRLLVMQNKPAEAEKPLRQAFQQRPKDIETRYLLGYTLLQLNKVDEAKALMDKLAVDAPRMARVQTLYGMVLMRAGQNGMARDVLRRAIELNPSDPTARETMVMVMAEEGSLPAAENDINEYLTANPTDPRALQLKLQFERGKASQSGVSELMTRVESITPRLDAYLPILVDGYTYLGKHKEVERIATEMVQRQPAEITGYLNLASAKLAQGQDQEVRAMLAELSQKFPQATQIDAMVGRLYVRNNDFDRAIEVLERHLQAKPEDQESRLVLAQALASLSLTDEALEQIKQVLEVNPRDQGANALAARIYAIVGKPDMAREHLGQIDEGLVSESKQPTLMAQMRLMAGDYEEAQNICNRAIAQGNNDPIIRLILAGIYQRAGNVNEAEVHLLALVRSQPRSPQVFNLLGRFYTANRMVDKGVAELATLQSLNELYARVTQAQLLATAKRFDDAARALEPLLAAMIKTSDRQVLFAAEALARIYAAAGDNSRALGVYQRLVEARQFTQQARLRLFDLAFASDDPQTRIQKLDALAKSLEPSQMPLVRLVAQRYALAGKPQGGLDLIDQWLARHPNHASLLLWKGDIYVRMEKYRDAADTFRLAVSASPENLELRRRLALSLESAGDYPAAEQAFRQIAELGGSAKIVGLTDLGRLFVTIGLNRQAAKAFAELEREGRPRDPRVILTMGRAYMALKQYDKAVAKLKDVPNYAPQYVEAQVLLARVEQAQGLVESAQNRLSDLARDARMAPVAARETLRLQVETKQQQELLGWIDKALALDSLADADRAQWLRLRINILSSQKQWQPTLDAVEHLARLEPNALPIRAGRLALMVATQRIEQAKRLYLDDSALRDSQYALPLSLVLGLPAPADVSKAPAFFRYLSALMAGKGSDATALVAELPQFATLFHHDLKRVALRGDLTSPNTQIVLRDTVAAAICLESGLPYVAQELAAGAVARLPDFEPAWSLMAEALRQTNQPLTPTLNKARDLSGSAVALLVQGEERMTLKQYAEAATAFAKLAEIEPQNPHVLYRMVAMYQGKGDPNQAIATLEKLLQSRTPYDVPARNDLAYLLAEHQPQRLDQAYELAKQALASAPRSAALQDTVAWVQHLRGQNADALNLVTRAVSELGAMTEVQYHAGVIYQAVGNETWARYYLEEAAGGPDDKMEKKRAAELLRR